MKIGSKVRLTKDVPRLGSSFIYRTGFIGKIENIYKDKVFVNWFPHTLISCWTSLDILEIIEDVKT